MAKSLGVTLLISNRPDGEEPGQPNAAAFSAACQKAGIDFIHIPVGPAGISEKHLDDFQDATARSKGNVLAFCRSGTRSTILRAFALARAGRDIDEVINEAASAGYNISGQRTALEMLSQT